MRDDAVLTATALECAFGGVTVLRGIDLRLYRGTIVGITGINGSGKTTLLDALSGLVPCRCKSMTLGGEHIEDWSFHKRAAGGLRRTFQSPRVFSRASVIDNVVAALSSNPGVGVRNAFLSYIWREFEDVAYRRSRAALESLGLSHLADMPAGNLSFGERKLVSIAAVLAPMAMVILLDEPAAGLAAEAMSRVGIAIRAAAEDRDLAVLVVEHSRAFIESYCTSELVLREGRMVSR